ncbi:MAG: hypothetical protein ABIR05_08285 [Luteimonas sp.]
MPSAPTIEGIGRVLPGESWLTIMTFGHAGNGSGHVNIRFDPAHEAKAKAEAPTPQPRQAPALNPREAPMRNILATIAASLLLLCATSVQAQEPAPLRVMFIGNSLTYVNNLPRLVSALAASQPGKRGITTSSWVAPDGSLDARWDDGHAAAALAAGHWDAVVLQERSGTLICMAAPAIKRPAACRVSESAHHNFAKLAAAHGTRVLLLSTWVKPGVRQVRRRGPDPQSRLDAATQSLAERLRADGAQVDVVPTGRTLHDWAASRDDPAVVFPDGGHPGVTASLVMAAQLYRSITGEAPQAHDVIVTFPMLPSNAMVKPNVPLEEQAQIAGDGSVVVIKAEAVEPYLKVAAEAPSASK